MRGDDPAHLGVEAEGGGGPAILYPPRKPNMAAQPRAA